MDYSKRNNIILLAVIVFLGGCQIAPKKFKITTLEGEYVLHMIEVDSNRVIQECYFMNASEENNWRHQYILHILNEKNEVIPVFHPTNQDIDTCMVQFKKIEKILKNADHVRLCVRDELEKRSHNPEIISKPNDFGVLGKHKSTYHALTFDSICNAKKCYSIGDTWTFSCPGQWK